MGRYLHKTFIVSALLLTCSLGTESAAVTNHMYLEVGTVTNVTTDWVTVNLPRVYTSMVVVCSVEYQFTNTTGTATNPPMLVRVRNADLNSSNFEVCVASPYTNMNYAAPTCTVYYMALEEGVYGPVTNDSITFGYMARMPMEAVRFESTRTDGGDTNSSAWLGHSRPFQQNYFDPRIDSSTNNLSTSLKYGVAVLGQVMSSLDDKWSSFYCCGVEDEGEILLEVGPYLWSGQVNGYLTTNFFVGKHVGGDSDNVRSNETLGYIVIGLPTDKTIAPYTASSAGGMELEGIEIRYGVTGYDNDLNKIRGWQHSIEPPLTVQTLKWPMWSLVAGVGWSIFASDSTSGRHYLDPIGGVLQQCSMYDREGSWGVWNSMSYSVDPLRLQYIDMVADEDMITDNSHTNRAHNGEYAAYFIWTNMPTAIVLADFSVYMQGDDVIVEWTTASEINTAGFFIERWDDVEEKFNRINATMVAAKNFGRSGGATYTVTDAGATVGGSYLYRIVEIESDGGELDYGPYSVTVAADPNAFENWKAGYFSSEELADAGISGVDADPDGDESSNYDEFVAGTHPRDPASVLALTSTAVLWGEWHVLKWPSVEGRIYTVLRSTSLTEGFEVLLDDISATPPDNVYMDRTGNLSPLFYEIRVRK